MAFGNSPQMQWQQQLMQQQHPMHNAAQDQWFASGIGSSPQTWNGASTPGYGQFQQQYPPAHTPLQHPQLQDQFNAAANQSPMANWNGTQMGSSPVQMPPADWWQSPQGNTHPQTAFIDPNGFHHYQHNGSMGQAQSGIGQQQPAGTQMQSPSQNCNPAAMQHNFAQTPQIPRGAQQNDHHTNSPPTQQPAGYDARDALRAIIGNQAAGGSGQPDSTSRQNGNSQSSTAGANAAPGGPQMGSGPPQQPTPEEVFAAVFRMMAETQAAQLELTRETNRALAELNTGRHSQSEKARIPKILDTTFTAQEIEKCQFTMGVAKWDQEAHEFETYIQNKDAEHIVPAMSMTAQQWMHATHPDNPSAPALIAADKYVARQLHLCLRQELPRVQNFRKEMELRMTPQQRASGRCVLAAMFVFQRPKTTSDMDELKQRYATTTFLSMGMSKDAALRGMHECVEAFEVNPTRDQTRFAVHNAILAKLPTVSPSKAQTEEARMAMEALRFEMMTYQKLITSCELDPSTDASSLNVEMFKATLAHALAKVPAQERHVSNKPRWARRDAFDASTCTDPGCAGCGCDECDDDECCESGRPEADAADGVTRTCWDCGGKIPDDHPMRKCNKQCPQCGYSYCPRNGDSKKECVITSKKTITESSIIHNKADPPMALRGRALRSLISGQEEWRKKQAARHAAAASEAAINQFAASLGVSAASVQPDVSEADRRDQEAMLGGVLETAPPEEKTYELINPPPTMPPCDKPPGKLQADASTTSTMNGMKGVWQWAMLDSGANCTVSVVGNAQRYADAGSYKNIKASIGSQGKGQSTTCTGKCKLTLTFETGKQLPPIEAHDSPSSRKCLIDQNSLWYNHRIKVNLDTRKLEFKDGTTVDLHHRGDNRLWVRTFMAITDDTVECAQNTIETTFGDAKMLGLDANSADACTDIFELDANPASVLTCATLLLAAARLGCSAQGLQNVSKCVENFPAVNPDVETRRLIDADVHRRASIQKRAAAPQANPDRTDRPGHTQCFDGYGPMAAPSVVGMHTYQMVNTDVASSVVATHETKLHQGTHWHQFVGKRVRTWREWGHEVYYTRFDRAGELSNEAFRDGIETSYNVTVQLAPAKWHEGVAGPEVTNDILTRMGECMCARANLGPRYLLQARKHAAFLLNFRPRRGSNKSRLEVARGSKPRMDQMTTYIFGCTVIVLRDKDDRGPPGSVEAGRTYLARYLGRDGIGHVVENLNTSAITYPRNVTPVNEHELVRNSMPPSAALHSVKTQTATNDAPQIDMPSGVPVTAPQQQPASSMPTPPIPLIPVASAHPIDGRDMQILLVYGGWEDTIDNIKQRILKRYPRAHVVIIDIKNDNLNHDLLIRSNRRAIFDELKKGNYTAVFIAQPCTTYSNCKGIQMRGQSKEEIWGLPGLPDHISEMIKNHNILSNLTQEIMEFCELRDIGWGVECSPARDVVGLDTHWAKFEKWGTFWHHGRVKEREKAGAKRYIVARCRTEDPPTAQKYYEIMLSKKLQPAGDDLLDNKKCNHGWHPQIIRGTDENGYLISQQMEEYTPILSDYLAMVLTRHSIPDGAQEAAVPPFSDEPRAINEPAPRQAMQTDILAITSPEAAIDDALIAHDGQWTNEMDAALCTGVAQDEADAADVQPAAAAEEAEQGSTVPSKEQLASLTSELKLQQPSRTAKDIYVALTEAGVECSLAQVKRVRISAVADAEANAERSRKFEAAREKQKQMQRRAEQKHVGMRLSVAATEHSITDGRKLSAGKATQQLVDVVTEVGTRTYKVPTSARGVRESAEEQQWMESDRAALNAIMVGGNHLMRRDAMPKGALLGECVTARRLKVDQATGELDKFKSRHALDANRLNMVRNKLGLPPPPTGTVNIIDDMAFKCMCGDIATRDRYFAKCDIGDAYTKGGRKDRPVGYMRMPETIREYDNDGTEMVVCLVTPIWGENEAGFEWDYELHEGLLAIGWRQCNGVPAMYYFESADHDCRLVKIVDDLAFSESDAEQKITKATIEALKKRYNGQVTSDLNPTSFAGYKLHITRDPKNGTVVELSQERKIVEATRKYLPSLLEGDKPDGLLEGKALRDALEALALPTERNSKLSLDQKRVQQILGDLKYFERSAGVLTSFGLWQSLTFFGLWQSLWLIGSFSLGPRGRGSCGSWRSGEVFTDAVHGMKVSM